MLLRKSRLSDLEALIAFAEEASLGITSLPQNPELLEARLKAAENSAESGVYLFSLESDNQVVGVSGIVAHESLFHAYQLQQERLKSKSLKMDRKIDLLNFSTIKSQPTEIGSLFLRRDYRGKDLGYLLSFSRFLFMATFPEKFGPITMAALRGVSDDDANCPFWEAIGRHFFDVDFRQADYLRSAHPKIILELFPRHPIYPMLLPKAAQDVIGMVHSNTRPARKLLEQQGFEFSGYIDLFDGGPHMYAPTHEILAVQKCQTAIVKAIEKTIETPKTVLISNQQDDFRATFASLLGTDHSVSLSEETADLLNVSTGDKIRYL